MNNSIRFSDIYLVTLLAIILMMWGLVGESSNQKINFSALKIVEAIDTKNSCQDNQIIEKFDPSCRAGNIEHPTFFISKLDRENRTKNLNQ